MSFDSLKFHHEQEFSSEQAYKLARNYDILGNIFKAIKEQAENGLYELEILYEEFALIPVDIREKIISTLFDLNYKIKTLNEAHYSFLDIKNMNCSEIFGLCINWDKD